MSEGRDLRNKAYFYRGELYVAGGKTCSSEKYSLATGKWTAN
jgi:hypothetical protein